jgi:lysophospholipase L1-like esterase
MRKQIVLAALMLSLVASAAYAAEPKPKQSATEPAIKNPERHAKFMEVVKQGDIDLVFLGDSITDGWRGGGKAVWAENFAPLKAANFGIGGDRTQHVLWRIQNGELDGYKAKAVVMMIGTNNLGPNTNEEIADGITVLVKEIQKRQPQARLLLLGIFPRSAKPTDGSRQRIKDINATIAKMDDGQKVFYMDIGEKFLDADGTLPKEIMPDALHPNAKGYQIWADAIIGKVKDLMGAK